MSKITLRFIDPRRLFASSQTLGPLILSRTKKPLPKLFGVVHRQREIFRCQKLFAFKSFDQKEKRVKKYHSLFVGYEVEI